MASIFLPTYFVWVYLIAPARNFYPTLMETTLSLQHNPIICQQYRDTDPHGSDPHGNDPHDENHDLGLKANAMEDKRVATDDVYGGTKSLGSNSQHPLDNFPGQPGF